MVRRCLDGRWTPLATAAASGAVLIGLFLILANTRDQREQVVGPDVEVDLTRNVMRGSGLAIVEKARLAIVTGSGRMAILRGAGSA